MTLGEFGGGLRPRYRAPEYNRRISALQAPCGAFLSRFCPDVVDVPAERFGPEAIVERGDDVLVRGWVCDGEECHHVVVEDYSTADRLEHLDDLRANGWVPLAVDLDDPDDTVIGFVPRPEVDDLLDADAGVDLDAVDADEGVSV